ncbi:MAG: D-glycero-beta-D-manno-heptose-7-phosphate kinase [Pseudomonadota bacterium]|nr:D-glycero-beta-D-manno-heptose-7-phosphate kinase [Pseudomonadota bacterium]
MRINRKVLCIGDVILDSYSHGEVQRISPEAPIPVLKVNNKYEIIGGCGNVARNVCAAGGSCHMISVAGNDDESRTLRRLLKESKDLSFDLLVDKDRCTTKKTRFVSENQQILRVDKEVSLPINKKIQSKLLEIFKRRIDNCNVVVISDYNKGVLTNDLLKKIIDLSQKKSKTIIVDPKKDNFAVYKGASIITPNFKELLEASDFRDEKKVNDKSMLVVKLSKKLIKDFGFDAVITTRSADGISVVNSTNRNLHLPSKAKEVFDVSGAGDTVIAYIATGLSKEQTLFNATEIANDAAGIAVGKFGTTVVNTSELVEANKENKICSLEEISSEIKKDFNKKIGFTNGCFDLIHQGHIFYLKEARKRCDFLILALNSDSSIRRLKGKDRPIINQKDRSEVLQNFNFVDRIVIFNEKTPIDLIKKIKPNFIFKGDDYLVKEVVGHKEIKEWGGKVILIKCVKGKSTSNIIRKIQNVT